MFNVVCQTQSSKAPHIACYELSRQTDMSHHIFTCSLFGAWAGIAQSV